MTGLLMSTAAMHISFWNIADTLLALLVISEQQHGPSTHIPSMYAHTWAHASVSKHPQADSHHQRAVPCRACG